MLLSKKLVGLILVFSFGVASVFAQVPQQMPQQGQTTEVSDSELEKFALAFTKIQSIDQQIQQKMVSAVQEEGVDVQRFNEMLNAQQDPDKELDATEEELKNFAAANKAIEEIQGTAQQDMQQVISDSELTVQRYQEIMAALRNDSELQQKLQQIIEEE